MHSALARARLAHASTARRTFSSSTRLALPNSGGTGVNGSSGSSAPPPPLGTSAPRASPAVRKLKHTRRREWTWVALSGGVATLGAWYLYTTRRTPSEAPATEASRRVFSSLVGPAPVSFSIHVRGPTGAAESRIIQALTPAQVARRLGANEASVSVARPACVVSRYDTNVVAANEPVEDRHAEAIVQRDTRVSGAAPLPGGELGDLAFFAVMDGHAGWNTSEFLSKQVSPPSA